MRPKRPRKDARASMTEVSGVAAAEPGPTAPRPRTAAVIIHWGDTSPTARLVRELSGLDGIDQVIIVANDAQICPEEIAQLASWVVPPRNLGFAGGFDLGRRSAQGVDCYLLLNNDIRIDDECVAECQAALADPSIGIVAPVLVNAAGLQSAVGRISRPLHKGTTLNRPGTARICDAEWVTGALMFIRASSYDEVRFDLSYFLGWEDADLCFRFRRRGWRVVIASRAQAWHQGGATIPRASSGYYSLRNRIWFVRRWGTRPEAWLVWLWGLTALTPRILAADCLKRRNLDRTRSACHGLVDSLRQLPGEQAVPEAEPRPAAWAPWA